MGRCHLLHVGSTYTGGYDRYACPPWLLRVGHYPSSDHGMSLSMALSREISRLLQSTSELT